MHKFHLNFELQFASDRKKFQICEQMFSEEKFEIKIVQGVETLFFKINLKS